MTGLVQLLARLVAWGRQEASSECPAMAAACQPLRSCRTHCHLHPSQQRPPQLISLVSSNHGEPEVSGMLIAAQLNISP